MAKKRTKLIKKPKKKWFKVLAPEVYNNQEIGDIAAFETKNLLGRTIVISLRELAQFRDDSVKIRLKINKIQGDTAHTEISKLFVTESTVQRISRRTKERFIQVLDVKSKDKRDLRVKMHIYINTHVAKAVRSELLKQSADYLARVAAKQESTEMFTSDLLRKLPMEIKNSLKKIYPIQQVYISRMEFR